MNDLSLNEYIEFAWENLWFMRPEWGYAYIPIGVLLLLFLLTYKRQSAWKKQFSAALLPFIS